MRCATSIPKRLRLSLTRRGFILLTSGPEALLSHELFTTLGWLGHFQRRTPVTMPPDVADYLADTIVRGPDGVLRVREPLLARYLSSGRSVEDVWQAFQRRRVALNAEEGDRAKPSRDVDRRTSGRVRPFTINGRFLSQPMTGVQRYAREIVSAMDGLLEDEDVRVRLAAPPGVATSLRLNAIAVEQRGMIGGQLWEQTLLPAVDLGSIAASVQYGSGDQPWACCVSARCQRLSSNPKATAAPSDTTIASCSLGSRNGP